LKNNGDIIGVSIATITEKTYNLSGDRIYSTQLSRQQRRASQAET
jgi:hypothetical protein